MYQIDPSQRRLMTLVNILPKELEPHLARWVQGGQYGACSTTPRTTSASRRSRRSTSRVSTSIRRFWNRCCSTSCTGRMLDLRSGAGDQFKIFLLDEAWRFLPNPTIKDYIVEALKTWRKRNAAMILATQSSADLTRTEMLQIVAESCGTLMFLSNPRMDKQAYKELFHLNETEADLIAGWSRRSRCS